MLGTLTPRRVTAARKKRKIDRLSLKNFRLGRLELDYDPVPFGLGECERIAREVQVDGPVKIPVWKGVVLVGAKVARAADRRQHALAVGAVREFAEHGEAR